MFVIRGRIWLSVLLVSMAAGCARTSRYVANRVNDLADIATVELTLGFGADLHAKFTSLVGLALGASEQHGFVMHGRWVGTGSRSTGGVLILGSSDVVLEDVDPIWAPPTFYGTDGKPIPPPYPKTGKPRSRRMQMLDIALGGSLFVGAHVGVSLMEAFDFLLGILTMDLAGDDYAPADFRPPPPPVPAPTPPA